MQEIAGTARSRVRLDPGRVGASQRPALDDAVRLEPPGCRACRRHDALAVDNDLQAGGCVEIAVAVGGFPYSLATPSMSPADNRSDPTGIPGGGSFRFLSNA